MDCDAFYLHCDQHVGYCSGDDKVEEPLGRCCYGHVETAKPCSRDFRDVDPANLKTLAKEADVARRETTHWTPAPLEEAGKEVDTDEGYISSRRHRNAILRWLDADI